jgi:hypothetical protein
MANLIYAAGRTGDINLWVEPSKENARRVFRALSGFGAQLDRVDEETFRELHCFQIGLPPIRIDILTTIDGVTFADAWPNRFASTVGGVTTNVIGRVDLLRNKKASGRAKDLADIELLTREA